jgi:serine/threonine-protein kinase
LKKDPKTRMRDIGEARLQIDDLITGSRDAAVVQGEAANIATSSRRVSAWAAAALAASAFAVAAFVTWIAERPGAPASVVPMRFNVVLPESRPFAATAGGRELAISSGGTHLAYIAGLGADVAAKLGGQLVVRAVNELDVTPLPGITTARSPFLSPDGKWIGYSDTNTELRKVSITGGPPITLCRTGTPLRGASWGDDDTIVFATSDPATGLLRVAASGGDVKVLTKPDPGRDEADHVFPSFLPGSRAVLFTIFPQVGMMDSAQVAVLDLESGRTKVLIRGGSSAEFVRALGTGPSAASGEPGYLMYAVRNSLRAVRFDPVKLEVLSDPVPVLDHVATSVGTGAAQFAVSRSGILVYLTGGASAKAVVGGTGQMRPLVWVDRQGKEESIAAPPHDYASLRLSPDNTKVALDARDQQSDIWVFEFARKTLTRLTTDPRIDGFPIWTPDGKRMIFESNRTGTFNVYMQAADGPGAVEQLTKSTNQLWPFSLSPDGTRLVIHSGSPGAGDLDLLPLDGKSQPVPLMRTPFNEDHAEISPDGRWLAYQSDESGQPEVHVRPFPDVNAGHWQVSPAGGAKPVWARNGRELFYFSGQALMAVPVQTTPTFSAGIPAKLFDGPYSTGLLGRTYDVSRDGRRFVMIKNPPRLAAATGTGDQPATTTNMVVVVNWQEELKQRVPAK